MIISSVEDIVELHKSEGKIEEAIQKIYLDDKYMAINVFTFQFVEWTIKDKEFKRWKSLIFNEIRKNPRLWKEIREFRSIFEYLDRIDLKQGYIRKSECPDFIITTEEKTIGVEVTKIYVGNEWAAEKLATEIEAYKIKQRNLDGYIEYKKYGSRIKTFQIRDGIAIMPVTNGIDLQEYMVEIKNKIFEKIRKLFDTYWKFDENVILVSIVSPIYFYEKMEKKKLNEEINYYVEHLEQVFDKNKYDLVLKTGDTWMKFNLKNRRYKPL